MRGRIFQRRRGASLIELLCVMAIISILLALSMGPIIKAFLHAKKVIGH
jgi:prepilin-type N-terminal cleavage/methylation domain-containing protein